MKNVAGLSRTALRVVGRSDPGASAAVVAVSIAFAVLAVAGCTPDSELAEFRLSAEDAGVRADVWVPVNEARSVGTYRVRVTSPGGRRDEMVADRDGMLGGVWLSDLDGDSRPELVVGMTSAGSGSYGSVDVYSDEGAGYERRELAALTKEQARGYLGHDVFDVADGVLTRSFPLYAEGDTNADPTGGTALLVYSFESDAWIHEPEAAPTAVH